ncbi:FecR family protein [Adhaeribacter swui]|uniref:FecR family protein n=1 Tax=Adhaeribacter swui TaxID=2086471 RepID=A0A7G7GDY7_9BACT|nr:FecR family protein [Adhaeribacter swui]QNF35371.1 FecR family protein [Adhaeribacter swui]
MENKERPQDQSYFNQADLILRYYRGELSASESEKVEQWLAEDEANKQFAASLQDEVYLQGQLDFFSSVDTDAAWQKVAGQMNQPQPKSNTWLNFKYAAVFLVLCVTGALVYKYQRSPKVPTQTIVKIEKFKKIEKPITPSASKLAQLTLANGTVIPLKLKANGTLYNKNGLEVTQHAEELHFSFKPGSQQHLAGNNTLTTPVGGQYKITLPDGSEVWLNASSELTFSDAFGKKSREVTLTGEGYFEVAKDKTKPFRVTANHTTVEVLGTHFNVMAYPEEQSINTTLLEGSVKVHNQNRHTIIKPGYQAKSGTTLAVEKVDVDAAVAWKNGLFQFQNTELGTIMRQLERWYGVQFLNTGQVQDQHFTGIISRQTELAKILKMLELSGDIKFKTNGQKIIILAD